MGKNRLNHPSGSIPVGNTEVLWPAETPKETWQDLHVPGADSERRAVQCEACAPHLSRHSDAFSVRQPSLTSSSTRSPGLQNRLRQWLWNLRTRHDDTIIPE